MKKIVGIGMLAFLSLSFMYSCKNNETYADKLKKERKEINRLINDSLFEIIRDYPENGVFESNQFYYDEDTRVYFNVVDSGNGLRATRGRVVYVRFNGASSVFRRDSTDSNTTPDQAQQYLNFTYGYSDTYIERSYTTTWPNYLYKSPGIVLPLEHVGDSAIVRIIVPFNEGSGLQRASYEPVFINWLQYDFRKGQGE